MSEPKRRVLNLCLPPSPECINPDSYGTICVRCGACRRKFEAVMTEHDKGIEAPERDGG